MYRLILILLLVSLTSCNNKTVELPQVAIAGQSDIQNHSQIWVFQKKEKDSIWAEVNMNNKINTTHWIVNIDKHLTLGNLLPVFQKIKDNRLKKSMHSKEGMQTFLSYSDTGNKKIALFPIDSIEYIKKDIENNENTISFFSEHFLVNNKSHSINQWKKIVLDTLNTSYLQLQFSEKLNYQQYMEYRLSIKAKLPKDVRIRSTEYIIEE